MNKELELFYSQKKENIEKQGTNTALKNNANAFMNDSIYSKYSYNFSWMGRPIIAYPQDMVAMQELIWEIKPDLIIETGVAHGGSIVYYASILELMGEKGIVVGIDIDIRKHNRDLIEAHPMMKRIKLIEGSSTSDNVINEVRKIASEYKTIMICLDSNHTHEHVLEELKLYAPLTTLGSYCVVFDTIVEDLPKGLYNDRPWDVGANPKTAVFEYLKYNDDFVIDQAIDNKILISVAPSGYLKRVK